MPLYFYIQGKDCWHHPERGLVSPDEFISLAEDTKVILPLGDWVLWQACTDAAKWPEHLTLAVNLSPVQFKKPELAHGVIRALASSGISAKRLELEITQSVLLQDSESTLNTLRHLRAIGVRIVMDDFGAGHSSLSYLFRFPFDKIKIDRAFVKGLPHSAECLSIVRAAVGIATSLGISTTAEGTETPEQLEQLRVEGCTNAQGYLFSPPMKASQCKAFMAERAIVRATTHSSHSGDWQPRSMSADALLQPELDSSSRVSLQQWCAPSAGGKVADAENSQDALVAGVAETIWAPERLKA